MGPEVPQKRSDLLGCGNLAAFDEGPTVGEPVGAVTVEEPVEGFATVRGHGAGDVDVHARGDHSAATASRTALPSCSRTASSTTPNDPPAPAAIGSARPSVT